MLKILHRVNTAADLAKTPTDVGVEVDLRDQRDRVILRHDAFGDGEDFEAFLEGYRHRFLVLNIKADGIEDRCRTLMKQHGIEDYFFLDCQLPTLVRLVSEGEDNIAVRLSEHEPLEGALAFAGKVKWLWLDCFTAFPLDDAIHNTIRQHFKICVVSPELQRHPLESLDEARSLFERFPVDAVCTDLLDRW